MKTPYQPKTGRQCTCKPGVERDNCPHCEGTGWEIDFAAIRKRRPTVSKEQKRLEYLRGELRAERISYGELAELQSLAPHIGAEDVELREAAGLLPEYTRKTAETAPPCNCPLCGQPGKFIRDRAFRDGSGLVFTCTNRTCEGKALYFYPPDQDPKRDL